MSTLNDDFLPSMAYNCLPYILHNADVPRENHQDITDLLSLLKRHNTPQGFCIKLVHKHFDIEDNEVMVSRDIAVPTQGAVSITGPMRPRQKFPLCGLNYFVNRDGKLQPYEYTIGPGSDLRQHDGFFEEFTRFIVERNLQKKLGLMIANVEEGSREWMEFEVPDKRGTIMIPQDVGGLEGLEFGTPVTTEWNPFGDNALCVWCYGYASAPETNDWFLAGKKLVVGSPLQLIVSTAISKL